MPVRPLLGSLFLFAASVLTCAGQTRPTTRGAHEISGNVFDDSSQRPMENIRVDLKEAAGIPVNNTFTHGNGEFYFDGLTNGDYVVEVTVKDYEPVQQKVSLMGSDRRGLYIFLMRTNTVVNPSSSASISAHELSVPSKAHDEYEKGMTLLYGKSDAKGAIAMFQRAIKDFPTFYEAYAQEGNAYMQLGDRASAEDALKKSVDISSGQYSKALFMLAALLGEDKRFSESAAFARKGVAVDPSSWQGPFELARALLGLDQLEDAKNSAIEARDMKPDNPAVYLLLANILIRLRDYPSLLKDLDSYIKLVPSGPQADQARKAREDIQASMERAEKQASARAEAQAHPEGQESRSTDAAPANVAPPPEPDLSGLPSLPPPTSTNQ